MAWLAAMSAGWFARVCRQQGNVLNYLAEWLACQREGAK